MEPDLVFCKDCKETGESGKAQHLMMVRTFCTACGSTNIVDATAEGDNYFEEER